MRKKIVLTVILILICATSACAMKGSADGFRNLKWGYPVSALGKSNLEVKQGDELAVYSKVGDNLSFENIPTESIFYYFKNDRFVNVSIVFLAKHTEAVNKALRSSFGEPDELSSWKHEWVGSPGSVTWVPGKEKGVLVIRTTK